MKFFAFEATQMPPYETSRSFRLDLHILREMPYMEGISKLFDYNIKKVKEGIFGRKEVQSGYEHHIGVIVADNLARAIQLKNNYTLHNRQPITGHVVPQLN